MKNILKSFLLLAIFASVGCEKDFNEVNIDPNTSPTAKDAQVLTSAIGYMSYIVDVDLNSASFLWAQYYTWGIGVSIGNAERFVSQPDDFNSYWSRAYANSLTDLKFLTKSTDAGYRGISKVLTAYIYQGLVDHFGDIPYSEAIRGEIEEGGILTPKYDDAASVYADLVSVLDDALTDLAVAGSSTVGADDLVHGGDISKWIKFANSLKLRILMRTSETSPNGAAIQALISSGDFISSSADIADIAFNGGAGDQNPMFARFTWGVGDFYFASNATVNVLEAAGDPRLNAFYTPAQKGTFAGSIRGIDQGTIDNEPFTADAMEYSGSSALAFGETNSVVLMSDWEVWFLRAEAAARYGTADDEAAAFDAAVAASFAYAGVSGSSAISYPSGASLDDRIDAIAVQKWISLNGTQEDEGWIETRRFDRPASRLFTDGIFQNPPLSVLPAGMYPASWLYPASERALNPNAPSQRSITDRLFWDN